jgi:hypothetical protein
MVGSGWLISGLGMVLLRIHYPSLADERHILGGYIVDKIVDLGRVKVSYKVAIKVDGKRAGREKHGI